MKFRAVVLVVGVLLLAGCAPSFSDKAVELRDGTLEDLAPVVEGHEWGFEVDFASAAMEEAGAFDFGRENRPEAAEGRLRVRTTAMPEVVTSEALQALVTGLAEGGFYLKLSGCIDAGMVGFFERADGGAIMVGLSMLSQRVTIETDFKMDHRLSSVEELSVRTGHELGPGRDCWPDPVVPEVDED